METRTTMNKLFNNPYLMILFAGLMFFSGSSVALNCKAPQAPSGACIECTVKFDNPAQLLAAPPLYWDVCKGEKAKTKIVYFLPTRISPLIKRGKPAQRLRTLKNGDLKLVATLNYHPWGKDSELNQSPLINALTVRYPNLRIKPIIPWQYESKFFGKINDWIKKVKIWNTPSGIGIFNKLTLTIVFDKQFAKQVKAALSRDLGLLGKVTFLYQGYRQDGTEYDTIKHPIAVHLGSLALK
jgi:hypothetical protein